MRILVLILATLFISGCKNPEPCKPVPCIQDYPILPTYKVPPTKHMTRPKSLGNGMYSILGTELEDCLITNAKLRRICSNYAVINKRINKTYK